MKILLYSANFAPEPTGIGKYSGEMASWLAAQGHEVRVVAAPPYYPAWKLAEGYAWPPYRREQWQGVSVFRAPLWVPASPGGLARVLHLLTFAAASLPSMLRQAFWRPDVVFTVAPAFVCAPAGWLTARLCGAQSAGSAPRGHDQVLPAVAHHDLLHAVGVADELHFLGPQDVGHPHEHSAWQGPVGFGTVR